MFREFVVYHHSSLEFRAKILTLMISANGEMCDCEKQKLEEIAHKIYQDDEGRAEYLKFERGDKEARKLWKKIVRWSLMDMQRVYDRLGVHFDHMNGESFYEDKMIPILEEGRAKGVIVNGKNGSWIIKPDSPEDTPVLVRKSDGATLYATRDLARIKYWEEEWSPDLMLNVVDSAQSFYFNQLFFAQKKLGLTSARNVHVGFGRLSFKNAKMSTRKGNILLLIEVLDEGEKRALDLVRQRELDLSEEQERELARMMGIGSIKYNINFRLKGDEVWLTY